MPRKLCSGNGSINSSIPLGKLQRLREYLHDDHGQAEVCLNFERDEAGHCLISGTVKAEVSLLCQRCLEPTRVNLESELQLKTAETDKEAVEIAEAAADPLDTLEIVTCEDGQLDLKAVIEDELIMSLPIVASHDDDRCSETLNRLHRKDRENMAGNKGSIQGLEELEKLRQELKQEKD